MDVVWCGGTTESEPQASAHANPQATGTTQSKRHSVDECGWASNELHEQSEPNPRTEVQQRTKQQNAEATGYRTTADPKARNISTGTAHSTHPTHTHTHNAQAKAARWAGRALGFRGVLLRGGLPAATAFVRDVLVDRTLRGGCAVFAALVPDLLLVLPC